jgi:hypothetical protein
MRQKWQVNIRRRRHQRQERGLTYTLASATLSASGLPLRGNNRKTATRAVSPNSDQMI